MEFLGYRYDKGDLFDPKGKLSLLRTKKLKDKGQRQACGCINSKDIGQYNTCPHECSILLFIVILVYYICVEK